MKTILLIASLMLMPVSPVLAAPLHLTCGAAAWNQAPWQREGKRKALSKVPPGRVQVWLDFDRRRFELESLGSEAPDLHGNFSLSRRGAGRDAYEFWHDSATLPLDRGADLYFPNGATEATIREARRLAFAVQAWAFVDRFPDDDGRNYGAFYELDCRLALP